MSVPIQPRREVLIAFGFLGCLVLVLSAVVFFVSRSLDRSTPRNDSPQQIQAAKAAGGEIINRLNAYHESNGRYPDSLPAIERADDRAIPLCPAGMGFWEYRVLANGTFELAVCMNPDCYPVLSYSSASQSWIYDH